MHIIGLATILDTIFMDYSEIIVDTLKLGANLISNQEIDPSVQVMRKSLPWLGEISLGLSMPIPDSNGIERSLLNFWSSSYALLNFSC